MRWNTIHFLVSLNRFYELRCVADAARFVPANGLYKNGKACAQGRLASENAMLINGVSTVIA